MSWCGFVPFFARVESQWYQFIFPELWQIDENQKSGVMLEQDGMGFRIRYTNTLGYFDRHSLHVALDENVQTFQYLQNCRGNIKISK